MSATTNLAGLYPPEGDEVWDDQLLWQPIPVYTVPLNDVSSIQVFLLIIYYHSFPQSLNYFGLVNKRKDIELTTQTVMEESRCFHVHD